MKTVDGNLIITRENAAEYAELEMVTSDLYVHADFSAPVLTSVGGDLYVAADFSAPVLTSVGHALYVRADFSAPGLTSVGGNLDVRADFSAPVLTSVGADLYVAADFSAPGLISVGHALYVRADFSAPVLTSVGGNLSVLADFSAPVLTSVGGDLDVLPDFSAPALPTLPDGELDGWKKCGSTIVHLRVPTEAHRVGRPGAKCRAEFADVVEIEGSNDATSERGGVYRVGERVYPDSFDPLLTTCSNGIHFFMTRKEAQDY